MKEKPDYREAQPRTSEDFYKVFAIIKDYIEEENPELNVRLIPNPDPEDALKHPRRVEVDGDSSIGAVWDLCEAIASGVPRLSKYEVIAGLQDTLEILRRKNRKEKHL